MKTKEVNKLKVGNYVGVIVRETSYKIYIRRSHNEALCFYSPQDNYTDAKNEMDRRLDELNELSASLNS